MSSSLITISGQLGSGKSTITKMLAQKLNWQTYSTGAAQREIAKRRHISTVELNRLAIQHKEIDQEIDAIFQNPPWKDKPCIVDSRLAFHFMPHSFKICLKVDTDIAAKRIFKQQRHNEKYNTLADAAQAIQLRRQLEEEHFIKNYHLDINQDKNFDLIIDTSELSPEEVCQKILEEFYSRCRPLDRA